MGLPIPQKHAGDPRTMATNSFDASNMTSVVYNSEGVRIETSRPNARELVAMGNYFWKTEDIGVVRTEAQGPADPSAKIFTVYDADGNTIQTSPANARELVTNGTHTWSLAHAEKSVKDANTEPATNKDGEPATDTVPVSDPVALLNGSLKEIANRVVGSDDVTAYLNGFSEQNLRDMALERFGEKFHHRAGKESMVARMVELEEAKLDAEEAASD